METAGSLIILWAGVPIYRQIVVDVSGHEARLQTLGWALLSTVLIQTGYWGRLRWHHKLPRRGHILVAHAVLFLARLSFVFGAGTFSVIFFLRFGELHLSPLRLALLLVVLFSLFCYTLELERLGKALLGPATPEEAAQSLKPALGLPVVEDQLISNKTQ